MEWLTRFTERWILQIALFATCAAHKHRAHTFAVVHRNCWRTLGGLVVGVSMNGHQRQGLAVHV